MDRIQRTIMEAQRRLTFIADHEASLRRLIAEAREKDTPKATRRIEMFSELLRKAEEAKVELKEVLSQADSDDINP